MFREMQRKKRAMTRSECIALLKRETRGVLSVLGDEGYPYGTPLNHYYCEEDGKLYFHGGKQGHRLDAVRRCDKASFCVYDAGWREVGEWAFNVRSVIVFGRIEVIEDRESVYAISRALSRKFTDDEAYIDSEIARSGPGTLLLAMTVEHMTGKQVKEC